VVVSWLHQGVFHRVFSRKLVVLLKFLELEWDEKGILRIAATSAALACFIHEE
jgi:hypothetical protein